MKPYPYIDKIKDFLLDILFPSSCIGCKEKKETLCDHCIEKIHLSDRQDNGNILAMFDYRDPLIKKAIWELKYHHKRYLGERLGELLYEFFMEDISQIKTYTSGKPIYVIPVPISNKKFKIRGYNQAFAIAKGFCNHAPVGVLRLKDKIVIKQVETIPQAKINNKNRRLKNIKGVFQIKNNKEIRGETFIVIDDVTTTGGTINEMMSVLKKAGAKKVLGLAVSH